MTFDKLKFTTTGAAGVYQIKFICEGVFIESQNITVKTSVNSIKFVREPDQLIDASQRSIEESLTPIIQILDQYGRGVPGKTPLIKILKIDNKKFDEKQFSLDLDTSKQGFEPSDSDGFMQMFFKLNIIAFKDIRL